MFEESIAYCPMDNTTLEIGDERFTLITFSSGHPSGDRGDESVVCSGTTKI